MISGLTTAIQSFIDDFETQLFTSLPAVVTSFDNQSQTVSVLPVMYEAYTDGELAELPKIENVPVIFPSAGGGSLTFPVKEGDEVLLVFSSRNYDTWWESSETPSLSTSQRFNDISDAIAIIGLTSRNNSVQASTENVELKFGKNMIRQLPDDSIEIYTENNLIKLLNDGTIDIEVKDKISVSNSSEELISVLSEALQEIANSTVNTVYGQSPLINKSQIEAIKFRLDTFKK